MAERTEQWRRGVTSGARYSGVPQKVFMVAASVIPSLHRPKSVILMWPSLSSIRFSNCKTKQRNVSPTDKNLGVKSCYYVVWEGGCFYHEETLVALDFLYEEI